MNEITPCAECGAPLADDQRYCLSCGARRSDARLPFVDVLAGASTELVPLGAAGVVPLAAPGGGGYGGYGGAGVVAYDGSFEARLRRGLPLLTLLVVLLLAVIAGLLLGHWSGDDGSARAAAPVAPQVITVNAGAPVAAAPTAVATTPTTETTAPTGTSSDSKKNDASGASGDGSSGAKPKPAPAAVKELKNLSGKDYQKKVDALPKTFSTGGKAPPKDNKPAAGGGDFEEIG